MPHKSIKDESLDMKAVEDGLEEGPVPAITAGAIAGDGEAQDSNKKPDLGRTVSKGEPFTVFTPTQKKLIVLVGSLAGFFSPLTGSIYYPAISTIAQELGVTSAYLEIPDSTSNLCKHPRHAQVLTEIPATKINLTVTTYLIIQGLAPMMIAGFSDHAGRRPAYMICFTIYMVANLGLGLQNSYVALLVLRMLQSGGSSGTIALAQGVVGDIITSAERGQYVAFASISSILGPTLSPILGGVLSQYLGWHSVFWFLLIFSGCFFVPLLLFHPETCRNVVGDGSIPPPKLSMNISDNIRHANRAKAGVPVDEAKRDALRKNYKLALPNPLGTLIVLTDLESSLILFPAGFALACFYAVSTGASAAFHTVYGFDDLYVSFMFIPFGVGGIISAFTTGKLVDWNFRRHATKHNFPIQKNRQSDLIDFPIECARLEIALPMFWLGAAGVLGYGWIMDHHVTIAGPIVLLFIMGYGLSAAFTVLNILMVDIYPGRPATATAANNIVRCELGAAATAAIGPMTAAMGNGWAYSLLALLFAAWSLALIVTMRCGMKWRRAKRDKKDEKDRVNKEREGCAPRQEGIRLENVGVGKKDAECLAHGKI